MVVPDLMMKLTVFLEKNAFVFMILAFMAVWMIFMVAAPAAAIGEMDLTSLSLEELMDIEITSVARRPQKLSETAAAAFIITQEDIQKSGVTTLMDALRMAPGIQVAQIDSSKWAVTSRGLNRRFANKLLVLMDGRTIYHPFYSGVLWEDHDILLEDIERIEVIRGPGGSIWGANAVNGIINIITKSAKDTHGKMIMASCGNHEKAMGAARYGGQLGEKGHYRFFAKTVERDSFDEVSGAEANNDWKTLSAGFRFDLNPCKSDVWNFYGGIHHNSLGQHYVYPTFDSPYFQAESRKDLDLVGGYMMGRWTHQLSATSETTLQLYYTHESWDDFMAEVLNDTIDIDFHHRFALGTRHEVTWGAAYRFIRLEGENGPTVEFEPSNRHDDLFSAFIQEEFKLVEDVLVLTLGSKFEHNDYAGLEIQPSLRIRWDVNESNMLWGAVSRGVRTSSNAERMSNVLGFIAPPNVSDPNLGLPNFGLPMAVSIVGNKDLESEDVWSYELGYRSRPNKWLSLDLATFYNSYDNLTSLAFSGMMIGQDYGEIMFTWGNDRKGYSYGFEAAADMIPSDWCKLRLAYTRLKVSLSGAGLSSVLFSLSGNAPHHQLSFLSMVKLSPNVELAWWIRYVDRIDDLDISDYTTLDARLAWTPVEGVELSIVGRNLLEENHKEYNDNFLGSAFCEVKRSIYGKLTWRF